MKYKALVSAIAAATTFAVFTQNALAVKEGDWILRVGVTNVSPNDSSGGFSGNSAIGVAVEDDTQPSINVTYMFSDNMGIDVLGALPFTHELYGTGAVTSKVGETDHLPPTVSLQYHFSPQSKLRPYAGIGINYTTFFNEKTEGAIAGTSLSLDDSWGLAAQVGVDYDVSSDWFINADLRYMNIETTATNSSLGTVDVEINPWVFTLGVGTTF